MERKVTLKLNKSFELEVSKEDIIQAVEKLDSPTSLKQGYFVEINGKKYQMMALIKELSKMNGRTNEKMKMDKFLTAKEFEKLGYKVWRNSWLPSGGKILFQKRVTKSIFFGYDPLDKDTEEKISFGEHEFTLFAKAVFNPLQDISMIEFPAKNLPNSGPFLIALDEKEGPKVLFVEETDNRKKFIKELKQVKKKLFRIAEEFQNGGTDPDRLSSAFETEFSPQEKLYFFILMNMIGDSKNSSVAGFAGLMVPSYSFFIYTGKDSDAFMSNPRKLMPLWSISADSEIMREMFAESKLKIVSTLKIFNNSKEWWKVQVDPRITFAELAKLINKLLGHNYRTYEFRVNRLRIQDEDLLVIFFLNNDSSVKIFYTAGNSLIKNSVLLRISFEENADYDENTTYPHCVEVSNGIKKENPSALEKINKKLSKEAMKNPYGPFKRSFEEKIQIAKREQFLIEMTSEFCESYLDNEYKKLIEKLIRKMARKKNVLFLSGNLKTWAAALIHAIGTINFLFDKSFTPYVSVGDIASHFNVSKSTVSQKSKIIRDTFKLTYFDKEFSTEKVKKDTPSFLL